MPHHRQGCWMPGAGALWHVTGHHKLGQWRLHMQPAPVHSNLWLAWRGLRLAVRCFLDLCGYAEVRPEQGLGRYIVVIVHKPVSQRGQQMAQQPLR